MKRVFTALAALAVAAATAVGADVAADAEPEFISSQWHALYLDGHKIGYDTRSLYRFADGGYRLDSGRFLVRRIGAAKFGYVHTIVADVDAQAMPRALRCHVASGSRRWDVRGRRDGDEFVLTRTLDGAETTARVPLEPGVTFRSWAVLATVLGNAPAEQARRWRVIDERLGGLSPDPCAVHVVGRKAIPNGNDKALSGTGVVEAWGAEQAAHLVGSRGRIRRTVWQSRPMVAEAVSLAEARRLGAAAQGPPRALIEGLSGDLYRNERLGFRLRVPPYPYVADVISEAGLVRVADLTDAVAVAVRPAVDPRLFALGCRSPGQADPLANLVHQQWAERFDDVQAEPLRTVRVGVQDACAVQGTARLGCTTLHFRNLFFSGQGYAYLVTVTAADRPIDAVGGPVNTLLASLRLGPPQGRLPVEVSGDRLRSAYYGFELRRPNARWVVPGATDGPVTALELARDDQSAVAVVRVLALRADQSVEDFVHDRAQRVADNLHVTRPEPKAVALAGRPAWEINYGGPILDARPARCRALYTRLDSRAFGLVLVVADDADEDARRELDALVGSLRFSRPPPEPTPEDAEPVADGAAVTVP